MPKTSFEMGSKKRYLVKISLLAFFVLASLAVWLGFSERGLFQLYRMGTERRAQIQRNRQLAEENQALLEEIDRLRTDLDYIESVARKELGLIKESEVIYRFSDQDSQREESGMSLLDHDDAPQHKKFHNGGEGR
jgi:cell division protein FtsB